MGEVYPSLYRYTCMVHERLLVSITVRLTLVCLNVGLVNPILPNAYVDKVNPRLPVACERYGILAYLNVDTVNSSLSVGTYLTLAYLTVHEHNYPLPTCIETELTLAYLCIDIVNAR
jgi:hypothetical protein